MLKFMIGFLLVSLRYFTSVTHVLFLPLSIVTFFELHNKKGEM